MNAETNENITLSTTPLTSGLDMRHYRRLLLMAFLLPACYFSCVFVFRDSLYSGSESVFGAIVITIFLAALSIALLHRPCVSPTRERRVFPEG